MAAIIIAAGMIIYLMDVFGGSGTVITIQRKDDSLRDFQFQIDTLSQKLWNKNDYEKIKGKLNINHSQKLISDKDYTSLQRNLNISYAQSMANSFNEWITSQCAKNSNDLYREMMSTSAISECKVILSGPLSTLSRYNEVLGFADQCSAFLQKEFDQQRYNTIINHLNSLCSAPDIAGCPTVSTIRGEQIDRLTEFKDFVSKYDAVAYMFHSNPGSPIWRVKFENYCPENNETIGKYNYYKTKMNSYELCR